jgi:hypothetical protein
MIVQASPMSPSQALPLDSPRWGTLHTRDGRGAGWVGEAIRELQKGSFDARAFHELWTELCSEDRTYDAAYAAAPYLVEMAARLPLVERTEHLIVLGLIATYAGDLPPDLQPAYRQAIDAALTLTLQALADCPSGHELRYLLSAVAAFRDRTDLASALQNVDAIQEPCPACGHVVFPSELQRIVQSEQAV